jgi:hypothetical protein
LAIGILRKTDAARISNSFKARGNVHTVTHKIAVSLLDYIAQMDADSELDPPIRRQTGITLHHAVLHLDGTADSITTLRNSMILPSPVRLTTRP